MGITKYQALADFVVEFSLLEEEKTYHIWILLVNGSSNLKGCEVGRVVEGLRDILIEKSPCLGFKANNN